MKATQLLHGGIAILLAFAVLATSTGCEGGRAWMPGDEGVITAPAGQVTTLGVTKEASKLVEKSIIAQDQVGFSQLLDSGLAIRLTGGTRVKIIDTEAFGPLRVRVMTGKHAGTAAYVPVGRGILR